MSTRIELRQFDTHGEDLDSNNDPRGLLNHIVSPSPPAKRRILEDVLAIQWTIDTAEVRSQPGQSTGPKSDPHQKGERRFAEMKTIADEVREQCIAD